MAKVGGLTVGIVAKPMALIGYMVFDRNTGNLENETLYPVMEEAKEYSGEHLDLEVKPVYVERVPES